MIDVAQGVSRVEEHGTSLQNYAHATVVCTAMKRLIKEGIPASEIDVLTFYKGQIKTIHHTAEGVPELNNLSGVGTVDAYQGREASVIILDLVSAANAAGALSDDASSVYQGITQHVRSPNRLCVALTRAKFGLIVVCNVKALAKAGEGNHPGRALIALLEDAGQRRLLHVDTKTIDIHPESLHRMQTDLGYRKAVQAESQELARLSYVNNVVQKQHRQGKKGPPRKQKLVSHRTGTDSPSTTPQISKKLKDRLPHSESTTAPPPQPPSKQPPPIQPKAASSNKQPPAPATKPPTPSSIPPQSTENDGGASQAGKGKQFQPESKTGKKKGFYPPKSDQGRGKNPGPRRGGRGGRGGNASAAS